MNPLGVAADEALESLRNKKEENFLATFPHFHFIVSSPASHSRPTRAYFPCQRAFRFQSQVGRRVEVASRTKFSCFSAR